MSGEGSRGWSRGLSGELETRTLFLLHRAKARQELTHPLLLPDEATHTQGKAVTLL